MSCMKLLEIPRHKRTRLVYGDLKGNEGAMTWGDRSYLRGTFYCKGQVFSLAVRGLQKQEGGKSSFILLQKGGRGSGSFSYP